MLVVGLLIIVNSIRLRYNNVYSLKGGYVLASFYFVFNVVLMNITHMLKAYSTATLCFIT